MRPDGRQPYEMRPVKITRDFLRHAEGSVLIEVGETKVVCSASVEDRVPPFLRDTGQGWVTAEYGMLPASTHTRSVREAATGKLGGRTQEIQRLIGRSLRASLDLRKLGERTITVDCDVIQADGGTRTASITGGYVALAMAVGELVRSGAVHRNVWAAPVAAVSVGVVQGQPMLDLCYTEDSQAEVDFNVVMNARGHFIEVQGTAENRPFERSTMERLLDLADKGVQELLTAQKVALSNSAAG